MQQVLTGCKLHMEQPACFVDDHKRNFHFWLQIAKDWFCLPEDVPKILTHYMIRILLADEMK
jgi:hypothetical protein